MLAFELATLLLGVLSQRDGKRDNELPIGYLPIFAEGLTISEVEEGQSVDSDDFHAALKLMKMANVDAETVSRVIEKMRQADGEH